MQQGSIVIGVVLLSFLIFPGYATLISDQGIYVPQILSNSTSFSHSNLDLVTQFKQTDATLFDELVKGVAEFFSGDIYISLLLLGVIARVLFFTGLWFLARRLGLTYRYALLFCLFFLIPHGIYGTAITTFDIETHPRLLSMGAGLLGIACSLRGRLYISLALHLFSVGIHPILGVCTLAIEVVMKVYGIYFDTSQARKKLTSVLITTLPSLSLVVYFFFNSQPDSFFVDESWRAIVSLVSPYVFISDWSKVALIGVLVSITTVGILLYGLWDEIDAANKAFLVACLFAPLLLFTVSIIGADVLHVHAIAAAQFHRSLFFFHLCSALLLLLVLSNKVCAEKRYCHATVLATWFVSLLDTRLAVVMLPLLGYHFLPCSRNTFLLVRKDLVGIVLAMSTIVGGALVVALFPSWRTVGVLVIGIVVGCWSYLQSRMRIGSVIAGLTVMVLCTMHIINLPPLHIYPRAYGDQHTAVSLCTWLHEQTSIVLALDDSTTGYGAWLRSVCRIPVYYSYADGAQSIFNRQYALEWYSRKKKIEHCARGSVPLDGERIFILTRHYVEVGKPATFSEGGLYVYEC